MIKRIINWFKSEEPKYEIIESEGTSEPSDSIGNLKLVFFRRVTHSMGEFGNEGFVALYSNSEKATKKGFIDFRSKAEEAMSPFEKVFETISEAKRVLSCAGGKLFYFTLSAKNGKKEYKRYYLSSSKEDKLYNILVRGLRKRGFHYNYAYAL